MYRSPPRTGALPGLVAEGERGGWQRAAEGAWASAGGVVNGRRGSGGKRWPQCPRQSRVVWRVRPGKMAGVFWWVVAVGDYSPLLGSPSRPVPPGGPGRVPVATVTRTLQPHGACAMREYVAIRMDCATRVRAHSCDARGARGRPQQLYNGAVAGGADVRCVGDRAGVRIGTGAEPGGSACYNLLH